MSDAFEHRVDAVDGLRVRFTSSAIHPDAGIAWPWHHAIYAMAGVGADAENPISQHFGDDMYVDAILRDRYAEIYAEVVERELTETSWEFTVLFTDARWIPAKISPGFEWTSAA